MKREHEDSDASGTEPPFEDDEARHRNNIAVLIAAAVIVAVAVGLMLWFKQTQAMSDCVLASHHNCNPVDVPQDQ